MAPHGTMTTEDRLKALRLDEILDRVRLPICLTDPRQSDNPIVYVNAAFEDLTGYDRVDVVGRNCRFLQGSATRKDSIDQIRNAIEAERLDTVEILNFKKDGTPFVNALQIGPIKDADGETILFFGSQLDVTEKRARRDRIMETSRRELTHRMGNVVNVMSSIIRMSARETDSVPEFADKIIGRLHALSAAHLQTFGLNEEPTTNLRDLGQTILSAYAPIGSSQYSLSDEDCTLPRTLMTPVTLTLHELATNAVKHGALGSETGHVDLSWSCEPGGAYRIVWRETGIDGVKVPDTPSGSAIIQSLVAANGGTLDYDWRPDGLVATLSFQDAIIPAA